MAKKYTAKDITVLEGLDPVRKRPGMYIGGVGSAGLHHLVWEIFDNAIDEVMNGYATEVVVTLHKDGKSVTVVDNGRGIPIDKHPKSKKPAIEVILTTLHAGGKFEKGELPDQRVVCTGSARQCRQRAVHDSLKAEDQARRASATAWMFVQAWCGQGQA